MTSNVSSKWQMLESEIVTCRSCPRLIAWCEEVAQVKRRAYRDETYWGKPVLGFGDRFAQVIVVGLAPGAHGANRTGRMFTGDSSGDFLYGTLHRHEFANQPTSESRDDGLVLNDVFISAVCRCAPPKNKPTATEIKTCLPFLAQELALLPTPRVIVALGRIAFDGVLKLYQDRMPDAESRPRFRHAATHRLGPDLPWLVTSYHPSRQNTQTGRLTREMFDAVWAEVKRLLAIEASRSQT
jgi:uracil-DNA glycosylase